MKKTWEKKNEEQIDVFQCQWPGHVCKGWSAGSGSSRYPRPALRAAVGQARAGRGGGLGAAAAYQELTVQRGLCTVHHCPAHSKEQGRQTPRKGPAPARVPSSQHRLSRRTSPGLPSGFPPLTNMGRPPRRSVEPTWDGTSLSVAVRGVPSDTREALVLGVARSPSGWGEARFMGATSGVGGVEHMHELCWWRAPYGQCREAGRHRASAGATVSLASLPLPRQQPQQPPRCWGSPGGLH